MSSQIRSNGFDNQNRHISYNRDVLYNHFIHNPTICCLCRGIVVKSLPPEARRPFSTSQLIDHIVKHNFVFPYDIFSDVARRHADTVVFSEIRSYIHDAATSKGYSYDDIDVPSIYDAMDTLLDIIVTNDVDLTTVVFDFDLHVKDETLYIDRSFIEEIPPEDRTLLKQMAVERIQMPRHTSAQHIDKVFDSLYEIFGQLFEDTRLEFNHRLMMIGMKTFVEIHHDFLDKGFKPRSDDLPPLYDAFVEMLQPLLEEYSPFTPIRVKDSAEHTLN